MFSKVYFRIIVVFVIVFKMFFGKGFVFLKNDWEEIVFVSIKLRLGDRVEVVKDLISLVKKFE